MTLSLFGSADGNQIWREALGPGAVVLRGFALADETALITAIDAVIARAAFRHMETPGGYRMSVAMSCCGAWGWVTDSTGYRYQDTDPQTGLAWPEMPEALHALAERAAASAGFAGFKPDACLINRYEPGARMSLHQDKDERDYSAPIVSVSLGLPAIFQFGGMARSDRALRVPLVHGDVVVWGAEARLRYHGVMPLKAGMHALLGAQRINLTFRKAW
ncbi:MAG TPA: DNA oxidative demethylase AlkB [Rhodocyclaceae bacterium]|nr:DNA oxidative demethylase AlkB [Rhodocyclaceae bacterium]